MKPKSYVPIKIDKRIPLWWPSLPAASRVRAWLPSRGSVLFTLLVGAGLIWAQAVGAVPGAAPASPDVASTGTVAYQGRLANPAGEPLTGTYSMIFRLYAASSGGAPLWEEQWTGPNSAQVSDGLFNVMLGSLTPIPEGVMTGNSSLWLGITVGSDDEMAPRVQLGSVPFAVQAITVPDGSVTTAKIADGAVTSDKLDALEAYSYVNTQEFTQSTTWTSLATPDQVAFTLSKTQTVTVHYSATCDVNAGRPAMIILSVDNGPEIDDTWIEKWGGSGSVTISGLYHTTLGPGMHTIRMKYVTHAGGNMGCWRRRLLASSIGQ